MFKKFLIFLPIFIFAFTSKFFPFEIQYNCDVTLNRTASDICYSCSRKEPNFVVYDLYGNLVNKNNYSRKHLSFKPDYALPKRCRSYPNDYTHSGYDRGHHQENASFDYSRKIQEETFLMSNIAPQAKWLNRKYWAKVERFSRFLAVKYGKVDVITGNYGSIGHLKHNVNIPKWWYKIIYIPKLHKFIGFLAPNINKGMKTAKLKKYLVDIKKIEETCNIKIF
jgi:endonuclease G